MEKSVIIIGGGIAGYSAGIYTSRANIHTIILEGEWGGQLMKTDSVENYPGYPEGIDGPTLVSNMRDQVIRFGCNVVSEMVVSVCLNSPLKKVTTASGNEYTSDSVIIATGANAKTISHESYDVSGERLEDGAFWNHGISACAVCDGALPCYRNKPIGVIGGGDSACQEALFLSKFASHVTIFVRGKEFRASKIMQVRVLGNPKITVRFDTSILCVYGTTKPRKQIAFVVTALGDVVELSGLFFAIGHEPTTGFLGGAVELDALGYIVTSGTSTNVPGVFACGDVQDHRYRQAVTAAGSGCQAALDCEHFLSQ